jgi:hypothetical protein
MTISSVPDRIFPAGTEQALHKHMAGHIYPNAATGKYNNNYWHILNPVCVDKAGPIIL